MSKLLFSVVIACHNHRNFIQNTVESVLSQKHPGTEVIVVDDGSLDGTPEILKGFGKSIIFEGLSVNRGAGAARNHGASLARGEYLVFLDGDDELKPWTLELYDRLVSIRHPEIILARCERCSGRPPDLQFADYPTQVELVEYSDFLSKDRPWIYNSSSLIVRRDTFLSVDGWSEDIFYQDIQDLLNKMAISGKTLLVLAPDTVWYRLHSTNAVRKVQPFIQGIYVLLSKAKQGLYPGGKKTRGRRAVWFGGLIFYWAREAIRAGYYRDGLLLLASKGWLIFPATARRSFALVAGRRPVEQLSLSQSPAGRARVPTEPDGS